MYVLHLHSGLRPLLLKSDSLPRQLDESKVPEKQMGGGITSL